MECWWTVIARSNSNLQQWGKIEFTGIWRKKAALTSLILSRQAKSWAQKRPAFQKLTEQMIWMTSAQACKKHLLARLIMENRITNRQACQLHPIRGVNLRIPKEVMTITTISNKTSRELQSRHNDLLSNYPRWTDLDPTTLAANPWCNPIVILTLNNHHRSKLTIIFNLIRTQIVRA